jgi:hypothetical protein
MSKDWRPVVGYEGIYEISSDGQVRSHYFEPPKILATFLDKDGYPRLHLNRNGKRRGHRLHRLVCEAFHGPSNPLHNEAAHLDGNRANAKADNLKWVSKLENHSHKRHHGTHQAGEACPSAKLTEEAVRAIRASRAPYKNLAAQFGVTTHAIEDVKRGRNWRHVR